MSKFNYRHLSVAAVMALGTLVSCQIEDASLEDNINSENAIESDLASKRRGRGKNCKRGASNSSRSGGDMRRPINHGRMDDRTCYANYTESKVGGKTFGDYRIAVGSNHMGSKLQPRMERTFSRANSNNGSYVEFKGTFRILEVGDASGTKSDASGTKSDGTYIAQVKGKHTKGGGPKDPAICLFLAKPVYGKDKKGKRAQVSFNIYREQIKTRGGSGSSGRKIVFLKNVKKGVETSFEVKAGFKLEKGKKVHYTKTKIGGTNFSWNIPQPERGRESGIRYGAYRVKGGKAHIQWGDTRFNLVNKSRR